MRQKLLPQQTYSTLQSVPVDVWLLVIGCWRAWCLRLVLLSYSSVSFLHDFFWHAVCTFWVLDFLLWWWWWKVCTVYLILTWTSELSPKWEATFKPKAAIAFKKGTMVFIITKRAWDSNIHQKLDDFYFGSVFVAWFHWGNICLIRES